MAYLESIIIRDTGGTEADVTAANALKVDGSAVTQPVNVVSGTLTANLSLQADAFQQTVTSGRYNQVEIKYDTTDPDLITDLTVTKTNGGDASNATGQALFTSGANTNGGVKAVTNALVTYRPHAEIYCAFTAIWTSGGLANSYQRIGIYDTNDGFYIGYEGTVFGVTIRKGGVNTQTAQASFNVDTLTGTVGSKYTRNGTPEAANFALDNLFRIRYGWLGAAPIIWEIFSPDGAWVVFHIQRHPNTVAQPTINNPDLPITLDIQKTGAGATVLNMNTACWAAGTSSDLSKVTDTITDNTLAPTTRSVITGRSSTGGGTYYNVKVTPSGALVTAGSEVYAEDSAHASGNDGAFVLAVRNDSNTAMTSTNGDYSPIAVNANGAVAINDGGNSITVDGSVTSTISGTVSVSVDADTVGLATEATLLNVDTSTKDIARATKLEDDPSVDGDRGMFVLAVRNDANAVVTDTDGDYSQISVNSKGAVAINDGGNSITVDGTVGVSGTVTVSGTVAATQSGTWILGANSGVDIGDVTVNNAGGASAVNIQDGGNSITVDGTVAATQSGTWILGANSGVDIGDVTINNASGASAVNIQDGGNSITVDGTVAATQSGTWNVVAAGDVAHDTADSGNPVKIGFQAETSLPTAVASNDRSNGVSDRYGRQLVGHIDPGMQTWKSFNATSTQTGATVWQPTAGNRVAITYMGVSSYGTTSARVILWFGASGDTTYTAGTDQLVWAGSFAPSTTSKPGAIVTFPHPIFAATTDHYLKITTDAGISIDVTVYGYEFTP